MSQEQRPGRVRMLSSGVQADTPRRRRTDPPAEPAPAPVAAVEDGAALPPLRGMLIGGALFVIAAMAGGVLATHYGLAGMIGR